MLFWLVCLVLTLVVAALVVSPLLRPTRAQGTNPDVALYRAQLEEIDRDVARQVLAADEADRARTEVARRLLAAKKSSDDRPHKQGTGKLSAGLVVLFMLCIGFTLYIGPAGFARLGGMSEERIASYKEGLVIPIHYVLPSQLKRNADVELNLPLFFEGLGAPGYEDLPLKARLATSEEMRANRPDQAALVAAAPAPPQVDAPDEYLTAIEQLRVIAPTRPDDLEAWELLAFHETELRNFDAAARAQEHVLGIKGAAATLGDRRLLLDLMVIGAGGFVSPEAEALARDMLEEDAGNVAARYYLGALFDQTDRPDIALRLWRDIVELGNPADFHVANARAQISDTAFRAGVQYTLPETRGPSFQDMDAASDLSPEQQQAMIGGMVAGLANRLATEGGPAEDWARLIRAYGVLGDLDAARTIWAEAQDVFVSSMRGMEILTNAARDAGVLE